METELLCSAVVLRQRKFPKVSVGVIIKGMLQDPKRQSECRCNYQTRTSANRTKHSVW